MFMHRLFVICCSVTLLGLASCSSLPPMTDCSADVKAIFADPPTQYSTAPLWTWNDDLTEEQVLESMRDLADQDIKQVFVHPRPGLMTPYLSEQWFGLWDAVLKEAERLDMNVWIYDENSYPSGFAGGHVPDQLPDSRLHYLTAKKVQIPEWEEHVYAVFHVSGSAQYEDVSSKVRAGKSLPKGQYLVIYVKPEINHPWFGGKFYVDLLQPGVTEKFLEVTLGAYQKRFGDQFGKRIPGSFTDEPSIRLRAGLPWSKHLPELFEKRWGYSLKDHLICLVQPVGDFKRVRHNYYQLLNEQFIEHWAKPYYQYCDKYGLEFTGHYWEHRWPYCLKVPDNMAMYCWQQRPGIDLLQNVYDEGPHGFLGNVRAVKELGSVANQLGIRRTICEAYGAGGWDLRIEDMKRIGDFLYVHGVNTLDEHYSNISMRGARKRDHPQYFSYQASWWEAYHKSAKYFARLSAALSHGREINDILLIEPTTTAWMYQTETEQQPDLIKLGESFQKLVVALSKAQVEYDIGSEYLIERFGSVKGRNLVIGKCRYSTVVIPPLTENLNPKTVELLKAYLQAGGKLLCSGTPPTMIEGRPSGQCATFVKMPGWKQVQADQLPDLLQPSTDAEFIIRQKQGDKGILYHYRRILRDGQLLFLTNTSINSPSSGSITSDAGGVEQWNPDTGEIQPYSFEVHQNRISADFELQPCGSLLLFLPDKPVKPAPKVVENETMIKPIDSLKIRRVNPNVLTIDYMDLKIGDETANDLYFFVAAGTVFKKHGLNQNPWEKAVQFRDELITKTFPTDSGFEATYKFFIAQRVPENLFVVIERPDLYTITCNGKKVTATPGQWWLDKSFGKIDVSSTAKVGENAVTIKASPLTMYHELEPAYVVGDFSLIAADSGFIIAPEEELSLGSWNEQGLPLYGHSVAYKRAFKVTNKSGNYRISLPKWYGSAAKVVVNGKLADYITHAPWECDVTDCIQQGANHVEVIVIGTLKNTLGPHHRNPPLGLAWPHGYYNAPLHGPPAGKEYSTVGYGLYKPFVLKQVVPTAGN